ncbi:MAG TPA: shikimate kinase [Pyrinomonadaceae bacterium]|nr:shikimate kinase [Pyrinomonadaceae bacterium]
MPQERLIIVGFMGSGKSTVARALARRLSSTMTDLDAEIARTDGRAPKEIIEQDGEAAFRKIETRVLEQVLNEQTEQVIALGGGAWPLPNNRNLISNHGAITIWLDAPFDLCWQRIVRTGNERPLAQNVPQARALYNARRPAYSLAKIHVTASADKSAEQIADEVIRHLTQAGAQ